MNNLEVEQNPSHCEVRGVTICIVDYDMHLNQRADECI